MGLDYNVRLKVLALITSVTED